jgi:CheY-like chemotaxis protein
VLKQIRNAEPTAHIPVLILTAKHITKEELKFLKRNNIHQLIQKGAVSKAELMDSLSAMLFPVTAEPAKQNRQLQNIVGKPTVLVVEDNPDNMLTVKALLRDTFTVFEATNGYEAVDKCTELKPNLVLMDIALPGMDGIEAFKTIRRDTRLQQIPVIALTASAMISDREIILAHGFDAYLSKPIEEKVFFKVINKTLYGV